MRGPDHVELDPTRSETERAELEIYLRVWKVLYPDADVQLENGEGDDDGDDDDEVPAA